ncbi:MAG: tetratricopeptide repeat protein [Acidobacteriales bacterium]|nr:tetratricopeptide repeat protein [Terriglobales bacterium]
MKKLFCALVFFSLMAPGLPTIAQEFEINQAPQKQKSPQKKTAKRPGARGKQPAAPQAQPGLGFGFGQSIGLSRLTRASEAALRRRDYKSAADYAQRAVNMAKNNADLLFLLGYTSRLAGQYQRSLEAYNRGLQLKGNSAEGLSGKAQTLGRMGRTDEAKRLLTQVINANPNRVNDMLILGEMNIRTGDIEQGIAVLQRAEARKPSAHSELLMATAYMKLKQPAKAKELLDRARRRDPNNVAIFRAVATYHREARDYKSAIATLKSSPRMTPDVLSDLAFSYELDGQKKEAAATYARAASADPNNIRAQLSAAQSHIRIGEIEKGKSYLAKAATLDADHYRLHAIRAGLAKAEDRNQEAIQEYNLALSRMPEGLLPEGQLFPIMLRLNLSELYKQTGDEPNARQQIALAEQAINKIQVEGPQRAEFLRVRASIRATTDVAGAEADLKQAMQLDPTNTNINLQYANLLWRTNRKEQARNIYASVLQKDPRNRFALESMGYLARDMGDPKTAEQFFNRLAAAYPDDYVAYLALGDMYTSVRQFDRAQAQYERAFKLAPKNPIIVANGANAAIESRKFELAKAWVERAPGSMNDDPRVMRERQRYLFHAGKYLESARLGYKVLEKLPKDRNASVYLAYDLYNLGRYDDVLALVNQYESILPKEPNFPLLAGHVHKQSQLLDEATDDYSRAIERDPKMVEAYVNRGYVANDSQDAEQAARDFEAALKLNDRNGVAHLGLAFSNLQLRKGRAAIDEADAAEKLLGESGATHLARATAYRQLRSLTKAEKEYRAALKFAPEEPGLHLALASTLYNLRRYNESLAVLSDSLRLAPENTANIYAEMAHAHAQLGHRDETLRYIQAAEREDNESSAILLNTGDALLTLGDQEGAMERFARALNAPDANRVDARLAIARLFIRDGKFEDATQQVGLAFAESRVGEASPVTAENLISAANIFLAAQDFDLATRYFKKAKEAGAGDEAVAIGLANTYLARGNDREAEVELASLGSPAEHIDNYDYMLAMGSVYRRRNDNYRAMTSFARATQLGGDMDQFAERQLLETAGQQGLPITRNISALGDTQVGGLFEDATIYMLDARLFEITDPALLPRPRSSLETRLTSAFRIRKDGLPPINSFFQVRRAKGRISLPSEALIIDRDTRDYSFNGGISPTLRLGGNYIKLDTGLQFTIRRDAQSPLAMNQNLFRQYLYLSTTSFGRWLAIRGSAFHEAGPFTERSLSSRDLGARLEFVVGRPWGKTAFITGYSVRDLQFSPAVREFFTTSTYAGLERKIGRNASITGLAEYIRSWRVQDNIFAIAQAWRPAVRFEFQPATRWSVDGSFSYARGQGFHSYDNTQSGILISYSKPLHRTTNDGLGEVPIEYPLRFSVGVEHQQFLNFAGRGQAIFRPVIRLTLF